MATSDFTIADVLAWARTKPADEQYNYCDARNCAIAQFGKATGRLYLVGVRNAQVFDETHPGLYLAVNEDYSECTFGKLVIRLEALLPTKPVTNTWAKLEAYLTDIEAVLA